MAERKKDECRQTGLARGNDQVRAEKLLQEVLSELALEEGVPLIQRDAGRIIIRVTLEKLAVMMELWPFDTMTMLRRHR